MISNYLKNLNSISEIFFMNAKKLPNKKFLFKKKNDNWVGKNNSEIRNTILKISNYLKQNKVKKNDRIILISSNRVEWAEIDLAIMTLGAITVPCFVTNSVRDNLYIIKDCDPKLIIIENQNVLKKNKEITRKFSKSKIFMIDNCSEYNNYNQILNTILPLTKIPRIKRSDIATIIYTSGTSGNPKGVVLSHDSIIHNLEAALEIFKKVDTGEERFISFLPLSHSYERVAGFLFPMVINAKIYFCTSLDKLLLEIKEVKPTIFSAVPRLYENIYKKIKSKIKNTKGFISKILDSIFDEIEMNNNFDKKSLKRFFYFLLIRLIFKKKIKEIFGQEIKVLVSGGAALNPSTGIFFNKIGLKLLQGYGQTEAAPLISCNYIEFNKPDTVGFPVKNVMVKISDDSEILVKGRNVMQCYWKKKSLTKKTIKNGWLHTGDLGYFDEIGRLTISGRKKDLIVTSGGDNISVQKIESLFSQYLAVDQVVIYGDNKPFLIALIVLNKDFKCPNINEIVEEINSKLGNFEKIRKFYLVREPFTYENGLLTQTTKIKRKEVFNFYKRQIDNLYK